MFVICWDFITPKYKNLQPNIEEIYAQNISYNCLLNVFPTNKTRNDFGSFCQSDKREGAFDSQLENHRLVIWYAKCYANNKNSKIKCKKSTNILFFFSSFNHCSMSNCVRTTARCWVNSNRSHDFGSKIFAKDFQREYKMWLVVLFSFVFVLTDVSFLSWPRVNSEIRERIDFETSINWWRFVRKSK